MIAHINVECEELSQLYAALLDAIIRIDRERKKQGIPLTSAFVTSISFDDSNCWGSLDVEIIYDE